MIRSISHTEIQAALDCEARHAFGYTGMLTDGDALVPKTSMPLLRDGRAWGAGVAAWHAHAGHPDASMRALGALVQSLDEDADQQREHGLFDEGSYDQARSMLTGLLDHYMSTADPLPIDRLEHELHVPLPSRGGRRASNRYRLQTRFDGLHADSEGRVWVVEFKLRGTLSKLEQIVLSRQVRFYAWAYQQATGTPIAGVIVDERWKAAPHPPRMVKGKRKADPERMPSHATNQLCTPDAYVAVCGEHGVDPNPDTLEALRARVWQTRHYVLFRPAEFDEAGRQLVSAGQLIHDLDSGRRYPIRNPSPMRCPGCQFKEICADPSDGEVVDALFDRRPPKRDREAINA